MTRLKSSGKAAQITATKHGSVRVYCRTMNCYLTVHCDSWLESIRFPK